MVRVQVGTADTGAHDAHDCIGVLLDGWGGTILNADVAGAVHDGCTHECAPLEDVWDCGQYLFLVR